MILLNEILPELFILLSGRLPTEDKLTEGFRTTMRTQKITLWLVFALQVFVDIHHTLREDVIRGLQELWATATCADATLQDFLQYSRGYSEKTWGQTNRERVESIKKIMDEFVFKDKLMQMRETAFGPRLRCEIGPGNPFCLFVNNHLLCGLFKFGINLKLQMGGVMIANRLGWIRDAAHLYNAARQEGRMTVAWLDVDHLISMESPGGLFIGQPPSTPEAYLKQLYLMDGVSAVTCT